MLIVLVSVSAMIAGLPNVANATGTNLALPTISTCLGAGSSFTAAVTASSVTNVNAWQVNVTFDGNIRVVNHVLGSSWSGGSYFASNRTFGTSTLFGYTFQNMGTLTTSSQVTLLTITFKILSRFTTSNLHIALATETDLGSKILNTDQSLQNYTTTDGFFSNCIDAPVHAPKTGSCCANPAPLTFPTPAPTEPGAFPMHATTIQALPDQNFTSDITLPSGDKVSWGFQATGLVNHDGSNATWSVSNMGSAVKVAILDSGVNGTQLADLQGQVAAYYNYYSATEDQYDHFGHGTAMASIVASRHDGSGVTGIAYNARIYSGKVLDDTGSGSDLSATAGITWAVGQSVNVISMSLGGAATCPSNVQMAINAAVANGITVLASAGNGPDNGNQGYNSVTWPGNCAGVRAISSYGLTPNNNEAFGYSVQCANFGSTCAHEAMHGLLSPFSLEGRAVNFTAPGNNILTWLPKNHVEIMQEVNGTSPATAFAAGLIALGYSRYGTYFKPSSRLWEMATPVVSPIESLSGVHVTLGQQDAFFGYGLLDATRMLYKNPDVNGDTKVDISDLSIIGSAFGSLIGRPMYVPAADLNGDGVINIVDLVLSAEKFGTVFSAPPSRDVWGSNLNYNPLVDFHAPQGSLFYGVMGECTAQCTGETLNLAGTVNPNIASYVSSNTNLTAYLRVTYSSGTVVNTPKLITFHASAPGQTSSTPFQVPTGAFWQVFWYIQGSQQNSFNVQVFADISLSNSVSSEGWGLLMYSA